MNIFKRLKNYLIDDSVSIQDRQYVLTACIGLASIAAAVIGGIVIGENLQSLLLALGGGIVFGVFTWICFKKGRLDVSAIVIAAILVIAFEPFNFFTSGGIHGGAPLWYAFTIVYIGIVLQGRTRIIFIVLEIISVVFAYGASIIKPDIVISHDEETAFADSFLSLIIVSMLLCVMIYFQTWLLARESERSKAQAIEIAKINKAQNRFFSNISHEIRTPISTIIGLNEMILREKGISREVADDSVNIRAASTMLLSLINDILDMSKIESGSMKIIPFEYEMEKLLQDVDAMIRAKAEDKGLKFVMDVDPALPSELRGDEVRIKQVLINLLNNAVKYTREGSVTFKAWPETLSEGRVRITYEVTDTGMGIREESMPHLFDAFARMDAEKNKYIEGTGLGLSIVRQLTELMDGEITVESTYGEGSTFKVSFVQEVVDDSSIREFVSGRVSENVELPGYHQKFEAPDASILIVDDNKVNLLVESKLLRDTKVQVKTAISGADCLELTAQEHFDVIFMDHMMPGMDGIECLHALRNQTDGKNQDTPVIILTANAGTENRTMYEQAGFDGYLLKPVHGAELEEALMGALPEALVLIS